MRPLRYFALTLIGLTASLVALPAFADVIPYPPNNATGIHQSVDTSPTTFNFGLALLAALVLTILLELPIMYGFGWRSRRAVLAVIVANVVSFIFLQIATTSFGVSVWLAEVAVVIIEFAIIKFWLKEKRIGRLILALVLANLVSAVIGTLVLASLGV